jgi:putative peptide zinc metalloprotease protein
MNLAEALDVLPEITTIAESKRIFRVDPRLVGREHIEEGKPIMLCHVPGSTSLFRLTPEQWKLAHLFDGQRSYEEIDGLFLAETGIQLGAEGVKNFAEMMEDTRFWYQTPQEKNIALMQKLRERRRKQKKSRTGDVAHITVAHWDADRIVEVAHRNLRFVYTPWFTALTLVFFTFMAYIFITRWSQIGSDTLEYYTFTDKSAGDLAEFWLLFLVMAFFHESAHAVTCKHYGGGVHATGFHLIYLTPAFFVDVTEAWVYANRPQRVITMLAGIWTELMICAAATVVWWGTPPGGAIHDLAYKVILITGVAVVLMNLNPLIKLDGYYILSETIGVDEIKERSTALVSGWFQRHILRREAEIPYARPALRCFLIPYAILSGLYSYLLLYAAARFVGNVFRHYSPEWAFVPTLIVAFLIFKSRIFKLVGFVRTIGMEHRNSIQGLLSSKRMLVAGCIIVLLLLVPIFPDSVEARFILEPINQATIRAAVTGTVVNVLVHEGQQVDQGSPVVQMRNLDLESEQSSALADLALAASRHSEAQLRYSPTAGTEQELRRDRERTQLLSQEIGQLHLDAPIAGTVLTPDPQSLVGARLRSGAPALEIADLSQMRARLFVPESEVRDVRPGQIVNLRPDSSFHSVSGKVAEIAEAASEITPGLQPVSNYKGLAPPKYYAVTVLKANPDGTLLDGMTGTAKIRIRNRSFAGRVAHTAGDFVRRKFW